MRSTKFPLLGEGWGDQPTIQEELPMTTTPTTTSLEEQDSEERDHMLPMGAIFLRQTAITEFVAPCLPTTQNPATFIGEEEDRPTFQGHVSSEEGVIVMDCDRGQINIEDISEQNLTGGEQVTEVTSMPSMSQNVKLSEKPTMEPLDSMNLKQNYKYGSVNIIPEPGTAQIVGYGYTQD